MSQPNAVKIQRSQRQRLSTLAALLMFPFPSAGQTLPVPLVYLSAIDATIRQEIRYASGHNFTGKPVVGYQAGECILTRTAAEALRNVQADLVKQGLGLKVYDCYRPRRSVRAFVEWVGGGDMQDPGFFPNTPRKALIVEGYIAARSGHSKGNAVDLTLVTLAPGQKAVDPKPHPAGPIADCTAEAGKRTPDDSVDMGTAFDCFDKKSHTLAPKITAEQRRWRSVLVKAMSSRGFHNYPREWWHFSFGAGDADDFDVPITARPPTADQPSATKPQAAPAN